MKTKINNLLENQLSRVEMKNLRGGWAHCSTSSCTLVVQLHDGSWQTHHGSCSAYSKGLGVFDSTCFCNTPAFAGIKVSSNGGVSRCTL